MRARTSLAASRSISMPSTSGPRIDPTLLTLALRLLHRRQVRVVVAGALDAPPAAEGEGELRRLGGQGADLCVW